MLFHCHYLRAIKYIQPNRPFSYIRVVLQKNIMGNPKKTNCFFEIYDSIIKPIASRRGELFLHNIYSDPTQEISAQNKSLLSDEELIKFYSVNEWWTVSWKTTDAFDFKAVGTFNFYPVEKVLYNWDDEFGGNSWAPDLKGFRPLDMFYEGAGCVGFYVERIDKSGLYLYKFDGETIPLHINFDAYLKLLTYSRGFGWWQNALVQINVDQKQPNVDDLKDKMPRVFPDFSWENFVETYQGLRINK